MKPILIVDFEATCWGPGDRKPSPAEGRRYPNEIIEFGCALLSAGGIEKTWQGYVMPVFHTPLTDFCTRLTGITQERVDNAPIFPDVLDGFRREFGIVAGRELSFASWGNFDRHMLYDDCQKHRVAYPFADGNHVNLKTEATKVFGLSNKQRALQRAIQALGLEFEGRPHSGVDDARNIGRIVSIMIDRGWRAPRADQLAVFE